MALIRGLSAVAMGIVLSGAHSAAAQVAHPSGHADEAFDFMNLLAHHGLHDLGDEAWNAYGQVTYISSYKLPFRSPYEGANSLSSAGEHSFTGTVTFFLGLRTWHGGEAYLVPEIISEHPLSGLHGLGGAIQNFELQKNGLEAPQIYRSRAFFQQTIDFGGHPVEKTSDPMQLGTVVASRRLVLRVGNFSVLDFFDKNTFAGDLRQQFFNMAFLANAAYDFAADARGYAYGVTAEIYYDDWALRFGRMTPPVDPNQLATDFRIDKYYGDQVELEHDHSISGRDGAVRLLGFRNRENMGRFDDAVAVFTADRSKNFTNAQSTCKGFVYDTGNDNAPDLCWVRRPNIKIGLGINIEQHVTESLGVFLRGMVADGQTEVYSYTSTDRSLSFGALSTGAPWHRATDLVGVGAGLGWISDAHANYLRLGGVDGFVGDKGLNAAPETVFEAFYSFNLVSSVWLSADFQHIMNPGFNADRGPVEILGARAHAEF